MNYDLDALKSKDKKEVIINGNDLMNRAYIDLSLDIPKPEILISIGYHSYKGKTYDTCACSAGEASAIVAPSKSYKTFLKSALVASFIGGSTNILFPNIKSHRTKDYTILDIDTEQGDVYAQRSFRRVPEMSGGNYNNYYSYATRSFTAEERMILLEYLLENQAKLYKMPVKLVSIDGIADFCEDTNDIVMSKAISDKIMLWTSKYNIHILTVIHKLNGSNKPVGHLGSFVTKKVENIFLLEKDETTGHIKVENSHSRGYKFDTFYFNVNENALPYQVTDIPINTNNNAGF